MTDTSIGIEMTEVERQHIADRVGAVLDGTDRVQVRQLNFACRPVSDSTDLELVFTVITDTNTNWRLTKRIAVSVLSDGVDPVGYVHGTIGSMLDTLVKDLPTYPLVVGAIAEAKSSPVSREEWLRQVLVPGGGR